MSFLFVLLKKKKIYTIHSIEAFIVYIYVAITIKNALLLYKVMKQILIEVGDY